MATLATEIAVPLKNRPGQVAAVGAALGKAGVNVQGGSAYATGRTGVARMLFADKDVARAKRALAAAGYRLRKSDVRKVVVASIANKPGTLARLTGKIAKAGINLDGLYSAGGTRKQVKIVLGVGKNAAKARRALR